MIGIYGIRRIVSGAIYVGSSNDIEYRWDCHRDFLRRRTHFNRHLQRAWDRYTEDEFEFVILELCPQDRLLERERYWIGQFDDVYNIARDPTRTTAGVVSARRGKTYDEIFGSEDAIRYRENLSKNGGFAQQKGKTYEEIHGIEDAARLRQRRSEVAKQVRQDRPELVDNFRQMASKPKGDRQIRRMKQSQRRNRRETIESRLAPKIAEMIVSLGYDLEDENFAETPKRVAKFLASFSPPSTYPSQILTPTFPEDHHELVIVRNIAYVSLCAHHWAPVRGIAHVGYVPNGRVVGLSKLVRIVKHFAHRMTLQERVTSDVANAIWDVLKPQGVMVVITGQHGCMIDRGVEARESDTVTSAVRGIFSENKDGVKTEFLELTRR